MQAGATVLPTADEVFGRTDMIIKVKEPVRVGVPPAARGPDALHLSAPGAAADADPALCDRKVTGIAYETITDTAVACRCWPDVGGGRTHVGAGGRNLSAEATVGGGVLISGVPGVPPSHVVIIGGGIVGLNALKIAHGMRARVTILETDPERMRFLDDLFERHGVDALLEQPTTWKRHRAPPTWWWGRCSSPDARRPSW